MKILKYTMVLAMLLGIGTFAMAQDYSEYLDLAMEKLKAKDCDAAQKYYNVYKELTGKSVLSVEVLIEDCKSASANAPKQIQINYQDYEVLPGDLDGDYGGQDGNKACDELTAFGKSDWHLPTHSELDALYNHKNEIGGFKDAYYESSTVNSRGFVLFQNFRNGKIGTDREFGASVRVRCIRKVNN